MHLPLPLSVFICGYYGFEKGSKEGLAVCQRKRFGVVLLLVAGLASLLSRPAPAQSVPSSWAAPGAAPIESVGQSQVIASTKTTPPAVSMGDSKLPPPDDGLTAPKAKDAVKETPVPPPPPATEIQPVAYVPQKPLPTPPTIPQPPDSRASQEKWENAAQLAFLVVGPENSIPGQAVARPHARRERGVGHP